MANQEKKKTQSLLHYLSAFSSVFEEKEFKLPPHRPWDHAIEQSPRKKHKLNCKIYPLSGEEQNELDKFLDEQLHKGCIRPSKSPMASFFFVKKKDGRLRPVQDYRQLNEITVKDRYTLPLINEIVDNLKDARYFTKLDIRLGYNNVRLTSGDKYKAAFKTNHGLYEPLVMFFGLCNAPSSFQQMMAEMFKEEIATGKVFIYIDDVIIATKDLAEHPQLVYKVLQRFKQNNLYLKPEKCKFDRMQIEYLSMIISHNKVAMDPIKVQGIVEWPVPKSKQDVQSFLGFCNFYCWFIKDFSKIARPMQLAFENLQMAVTTAPVLVIPNRSDPFRLETDASQFAIGAVLSQQVDDTWRPVAFLFKSLSETQCNYQIYDRELMVIVLAFEAFRHYLIGHPLSVEVWTDHTNLQYFREP
jgi:hypothetical protein